VTTTTKIDQVDRTTVDVTASPLANVFELISNGNFETGDFNGWTSFISGHGAWAMNDGSLAPPPVFPDSNGKGNPLSPISGSYDVVSYQPSGWVPACPHPAHPGTHVLSQAIKVPTNIASATLSWSDRIRNHAGWLGDPSQEWRVLIRDTAGNLIQEVFSTDPGDETLQIGPNNRSFNVTSLLQSLEGPQIRVSFEQQDSWSFFNATLDNASLQVTTGSGFDVTTTTQINRLTTTTITTDEMASTEVRTRIEDPLEPNLRSIDVRNTQSAQRALRIVDRAIEDVARFRGEAGAFQERILKTSQSNVQSLLVNMLDAESKVRDTDYSKEITEYVGQRIQHDAGLTVLALANQNVFAVLDLLRGSGSSDEPKAKAGFSLDGGFTTFTSAARAVQEYSAQDA